MANLPDSQVEGITGFTPSSTTSYRYVISQKSEQVNIWLEDRSSKKQWQTGILNKEDYITTANVFVDASAADYVSCFRQCLDSPFGEEDAERSLIPKNGGKLQLKLSLKIRLLRSARTISYTFELKPIAVERIDILELKLKDQQEELERLRAKVDSGASAFVYVESESVIGTKLKWKEVNSDIFTLDDDGTSVKILMPGLYAFGLVVNHTPVANGSNGLILLVLNTETIQSAASGSSYNNSGYGQSYTSHQTSSSLMCVIQVEKNAQLSVVCANTTATSNVASYLTAARIGG